MAKVIHCKDIGFTCSFVARGESEEDLLQQIAHHTATVHGVTEITPELAAQVKDAIRNE